MNTHRAPGPTQIRHPWKTTLRTMAQTVIALVPVLIVAVPILVEELGPWLPEAWAAWLAGLVAFLVALTGAASRIMAVPAVNDLLRRIGLDAGDDA